MRLVSDILDRPPTVLTREAELRPPPIRHRCDQARCIEMAYRKKGSESLVLLIKKGTPRRPSKLCLRFGEETLSTRSSEAHRDDL